MSDDKVQVAGEDIRDDDVEREGQDPTQTPSQEATPAEQVDEASPADAQTEAEAEVPEDADASTGGDEVAVEAAAAEGASDETETDEAATDEAGADEAEAEADEAEPEPEPAPLPPPDPRSLRIRFLEAELAAREETLREYIKAHKKAQTEFDAFKQRLLRDQEREIGAARAKAVEPMLDVHDNLKRTLDAVRGGGSFESLLDGVEFVARQFIQTLEAMGLERHDPTGETFDPATMNALAVVPVTDPELVNKVVVTIQPGFRLGEREIRPALVQVGRKA